MRRFLPLLIGVFVVSLVWLGASTYLRHQELDWDGTMPEGMDFIGTWQIESRVTDGNELSGDNLKRVRDYGFDSFVVLNLDASAELNLYGNVFYGGWLAESETEATISTDQVRKPMRLEGEKLILGDEQDYFVFIRSTPEAYEEFLSKKPEMELDSELLMSLGIEEYLRQLEETEKVEEQTEQKDEKEQQTVTVVHEEPNEWGIYPMDVTIADDALVTIKVTGRTTDHLGCSGYYMTIKNNSDKPFTVTRAIDTFTVNGKPATPVLSENLDPGETVDIFMWWDAAEVASIDKLVKVEGVIEVDELNGFDAYATYEFKVH